MHGTAKSLHECSFCGTVVAKVLEKNKHNICYLCAKKLAYMVKKQDKKIIDATYLWRKRNAKTSK